MPANSPTVIHVNRQLLAMTAKDGVARPAFIVRQGNTVRYASAVRIHGPSTMVSPGRRLPCGARAWLETQSPVTLEGETNFAAAKRGGLLEAEGLGG